MRQKTPINLATMLAAAAFLAPVALAQGPEGCPDSVCVASQTSLVYNQTYQTMDAFTSATTDYATAASYDLCVNLSISRVNGPYVVNWTTLLPSATPPYCAGEVVELEQSGSVVATPGRQYFAAGYAQLYIFITYSEIYYDCGDYCGDNWYYDAEGYSHLLSTTGQPSNANWPSLVYSYPAIDEPEPYNGQAIAMNGSGAAAWAPPIINSVNPNQWPAGATTTVTISGLGFGYNPGLSIAGRGITGYSSPCTSTPSSSCDTQIVATVTIDPNTPGSSEETITVTVGGQNPDGYFPVDIGPAPQATAQATTQPFTPPVPYIMWGVDTGNGSICNRSGGGGTLVTGTQNVFVGQQIAFTACVPALPAGVQITSESWTPALPIGTAVSGYTASQSSGALGWALSDAECSTAQYCDFPVFYWVDDGSSSYIRQFTRQFTFTYKVGNLSSIATVAFNVNGPATTVMSATASPDVTISTIGGNPTMLLRTATMDGMDFTASASFPGGTPQQPQFVQLVTANLITFRESDGHSPDSSLRCTPNALSNGQQALDDAGGLSFYYPLTQNPYSSTSTTSDSPSVGMAPYTPSAAVGELLNSMSFAMYLMWDPQQPSGCTPMGTAGARTTCTSIPVPLGTLNWHWSCDGINTSQS